MERFFTIAGSVIRISGADEDMFTDPGVLTPFETDEREADRQIHCRVVDQLSEAEGEVLYADPGRKILACGDRILTYIGAVERSTEAAYIRLERSGRVTRMEIKRSEIRGPISGKTMLHALEAEHIVVENGGFLFHASCICHNGEAILFTAPSGTGKSTQAALWEKYRNAEIINGDRIMVRPTDKGCDILGIPYSGSSGICKNKTLPLKAIVYLQQGKENRIKRLSGVPAFRRIWEGCSLHTWNRAEVERCMETVSKTISNVPVLYLSCTPDEQAVQTLEQAIKKWEV